MNIFLTFDYELFFGSPTGSVQKCMIEPTNRLLELARGKEVYYTFFIDVGCLIRMEGIPALQSDLAAIKDQIKRMLEEGHATQLHIHPHWEKAIWENGEWILDVNGCYKISDFPQKEREEIFAKYLEYLFKLTNQKSLSYRAGGWCIEPFNDFKDLFERGSVKIDSSVFAGGFLQTENYNVDFRRAPDKSKYRFENSTVEEHPQGRFWEYPISSMRYSPLFYWRLYILGRLFPSQHKMLGDGIFISQGGHKKRVLTSFTRNHVSSDGYFASKLNSALKHSISKGHQEMVVIGHPKSLTNYSIKKISRFIQANHNQHSFKSLYQEACEL